MRPPPKSTRTDTPSPYTTLLRSLEISMSYDSRMRWVFAGQYRRMAGAVFGRAMLLIARRKDDARGEPRQPTGEMAAIFGEQVGGKLVDCNDDEQLWRRGRGGHLRRRCRRILSEADRKRVV